MIGDGQQRVDLTLWSQGHKIMLASPVTVPEVGVQISGNESVVRRLWGEAGQEQSQESRVQPNS